MKLMILNASSADKELILFLKSQTSLEVVTLSQSQLDNVMTQRTPEAKLQAFNSLIDGKQTVASEDDADWNIIDNLAHNKEIDART
jgi:hypothetical protein